MSNSSNANTTSSPVVIDNLTYTTNDECVIIVAAVKSYTKAACVLGGSIRCERAIFGSNWPPALGRRVVVSCCQIDGGSRNKWKVTRLHRETSAPVSCVNSECLLMQIARYIVQREKMFRVRALQHGYRCLHGFKPGVVQMIGQVVRLWESKGKIQFNTTQKAFIFVEDPPAGTQAPGAVSADTNADGAGLPSIDDDNGSGGHSTKHIPRVMFPDKLEGPLLLHAQQLAVGNDGVITSNSLVNGVTEMTKIIRVLGHKLPKGWHKTITAYWVRVGLATPIRGQKRSYKMVIPLVLPAHLKSLFLRAAWRLACLDHGGLVSTQALYKTFCSHAKTKYLSRGWVPRVIAAWSAEGLVALVSQTLFVMLPADSTVYHYQEPPHPYPHPEHPHHTHKGGVGAGAKGAEMVVKVVVEGVPNASLKAVTFVCGAGDKVVTLRDELLATVLEDEGGRGHASFQLCGTEDGKRVPLGMERPVAEAMEKCSDDTLILCPDLVATAPPAPSTPSTTTPSPSTTTGHTYHRDQTTAADSVICHQENIISQLVEEKRSLNERANMLEDRALGLEQDLKVAAQRNEELQQKMAEMGKKIAQVEKLMPKEKSYADILQRKHSGTQTDAEPTPSSVTHALELERHRVQQVLDQISTLEAEVTKLKKEKSHLSGKINGDLKLGNVSESTPTGMDFTSDLEQVHDADVLRMEVMRLRNLIFNAFNGVDGHTQGKVLEALTQNGLSAAEVISFLEVAQGHPCHTEEYQEEDTQNTDTTTTTTTTQSAVKEDEEAYKPEPQYPSAVLTSLQLTSQHSGSGGGMRGKQRTKAPAPLNDDELIALFDNGGVAGAKSKKKKKKKKDKKDKKDKKKKAVTADPGGAKSAKLQKSPLQTSAPPPSHPTTAKTTSKTTSKATSKATSKSTSSTPTTTTNTTAAAAASHNKPSSSSATTNTNTTKKTTTSSITTTAASTKPSSSAQVAASASRSLGKARTTTSSNLLKSSAKPTPGVSAPSKSSAKSSESKHASRTTTTTTSATHPKHSPKQTTSAQANRKPKPQTTTATTTTTTTAAAATTTTRGDSSDSEIDSDSEGKSPVRGGRGAGVASGASAGCRVVTREGVRPPRDDETCPLCLEDLEETDLNFYPCPCRYQVCLWCLQKLQQEHDGRCPACRKKYEEKNFLKEVWTEVSNERKGSSSKKTDVDAKTSAKVRQQQQEEAAQRAKALQQQQRRVAATQRADQQSAERKSHRAHHHDYAETNNNNNNISNNNNNHNQHTDGSTNPQQYHQHQPSRHPLANAAQYGSEVNEWENPNTQHAAWGNYSNPTATNDDRSHYARTEDGGAGAREEAAPGFVTTPGSLSRAHSAPVWGHPKGLLNSEFQPDNPEVDPEMLRAAWGRDSLASSTSVAPMSSTGGMWGGALTPSLPSSMPSTHAPPGLWDNTGTSAEANPSAGGAPNVWEEDKGKSVGVRASANVWDRVGDSAVGVSPRVSGMTPHMSGSDVIPSNNGAVANPWGHPSTTTTTTTTHANGVSMGSAAGTHVWSTGTDEPLSHGWSYEGATATSSPSPILMSMAGVGSGSSSLPSFSGGGMWAAKPAAGAGVWGEGGGGGWGGGGGAEDDPNKGSPANPPGF